MRKGFWSWVGESQECLLVSNCDTLKGSEHQKSQMMAVSSALNIRPIFSTGYPFQGKYMNITDIYVFPLGLRFGSGSGGKYLNWKLSAFSIIIDLNFWKVANFMKTNFFNTGGPLTPNMTPQGYDKIKLFFRRWTAGVISFPTRYFTTIIYFWPYWHLTPKGSFFGPENVSSQFLVKNRHNVQNFIKIAFSNVPPALFSKREKIVLNDFNIY